MRITHLFPAGALFAIFAAGADTAGPTSAAGEYTKHFAALTQLSVEVARAMPPGHYHFRPHAESMTFGQLMSDIAKTNYQFCSGLQDSATPNLPAATGKEAVVKFLADSFGYCSGMIPKLTDASLGAIHNSPDGRLTGREILLAMYVHVAHHRGQTEIYLRNNGIAPPSYKI